MALRLKKLPTPDLSRFGLEIVVLDYISCIKIKAYVVASKVKPNKVEKFLYKNYGD